MTPAPAGRGRTIAFAAVTGVFGVFTGLLLFGLPLLVLGWFDTEDGGIHRFHSLSWGAFTGILLAVPALVQLRHAERKVAAFQGMGAALIAAVLGYVVSGEFAVFDFAILVAMFAGVAWLHPARDELLRIGRPSFPLMAIAAVAAVPLLVYALGQGDLQRSAPGGDLHALHDHYLDMARVAFGLVLVALVASLGGRGFRIPGWCAGGAAAFLGLAALTYPEHASSFGTAWGAVVLGGGLLFIAVTEWEARRRRVTTSTSR
jgi:hypothetical protein